jgi:hypothetical protein
VIALKNNNKLLLLLAVALVGCCPENKPALEAVPIQVFLGQVGEGLHNMQEKEQGTRTGLLPSELTMTLDVSVKKTDDNHAEISVSPPTGAPVNGSLSAGGTWKKEDNKANTLTITFKNIMFEDYVKSVDDMEKVLGFIKGGPFYTTEVVDSDGKKMVTPNVPFSKKFKPAPEQKKP